MRQKRHLGRHAKALHFFGRHQRDAGQQLGIRVFVDVGVGNEQGVLFQHQRVQRRQAGRTVFQTQHRLHMGDVAVKFADQAAQHRVRVPDMHHQRGNQGVGAAHCRLGRIRRDAVAPHQAVVGFPILAETRVVVRVADFDVDAGLQAQAGGGDARLDDGGAANQNRPRQTVVDSGLRGAQHALVFALGVGDALQVGLGGGKHRAHKHAGLVDKARQAFAIRLDIGNRARGHARLGRSLRHGGRNTQNQARVKRRRNQIIRPKAQLFADVGRGHFGAHFFFGEVGNLAHAGQLHFLGDFGGAAIERTTEDVRKAQHVVDLVRVVRAASRHDAVGAHRLGQLGANLRLGIGQRQDDRLVGHGFQHLGRQHAGGRAAQKHVRAVDRIGHRARLGFLRKAGFGLVVATGAAFVNHPLGIANEDVLKAHAQTHHHVQAGQRGSAGARDRDFDAANVFAYQLQTVEQRGAGDDGRAVLVVVEHRNVHALAQLALDVEALGRFDVFEVDAAQRGFERGNHVDEFVGVVLGQFDIEHIDTGEFFEQTALALHHRLGCKRADIAQPQHSRAVGDDADQVAARREVKRQRRVGLDV